MDTDKNFIKKDDFLKDILIILRETFEGSPEGQPSAYLDRGTGIFSTLKSLSAAEASREFGGSTIAAHTEHLKFYVDRLREFMTGHIGTINWEQSWLIETVNDEEWDALRQTVHTSYENLLRTVAEIEVWNQNNIGDFVAIITHTAYHLGAIRQMLKNT